MKQCGSEIEPRQNTSSLGLADPALQPLFSLIKRVTLRRQEEARTVMLDDLSEALRFCEVTNEDAREFLSRYLNGAFPEPAEAIELLELAGLQHPVNVRMELSSDVQALLLALFARYGLCLQVREAGTREVRMAAESMRKALENAANAAVPGQEGAAAAAAIHLALQLMKARNAPAHVLLHGADGTGTSEMARGLASVLAQHGYGVCEIDCSAYRHGGEAASLTGSKSYWSGSHAGLVTAPIFENPRTVVIFHGADRTVARVLEVLRPAFETGFLVDDYGLVAASEAGEKRLPTRVDCRQSVFLFTASAGSEWHQNADLAERLADQDESGLAIIRTALQMETVCHQRGDELPAFDKLLLSQLEKHLVLLRPQSWECLVARTRESAQIVCEDFAQKLGCKLSLPQDFITLHLLRNAGRRGIAATAPDALEGDLLAALTEYIIRNAHLDISMVRIKLEDAHLLEESQRALKGAPLMALARADKALLARPTFRQRGKALIMDIALSRVRVPVLEDYTQGDFQLVARVPEETLDAVAGHEDAKAFLGEMAAYFAEPERARKLGVELPRGVVLYGPPGTGKSMLARAFAGSAGGGLPFIATTGADLLHHERVRQLYQLANRQGDACVIFIDECDALGKRGERSATHDVAINKLLAEAQGFGRGTAIFHILATNRIAQIDPALTRPGRFDRNFFIGPLDRDGREAMLQRTLSRFGLRVAEEDAERLLRLSDGLTGAALAQVHRECGLRLLRQKSEVLCYEDVLEELAAVKYGRPDLCQVRDDNFRTRVAVHELGHALVHHYLRPNIAIEQVAIGQGRDAAGFLALVADNAAHSETAASVRAYIAVLLAGRVAEQLRFGLAEGASSGATSDLARATQAVFRAVAHAGMDPELGLISVSAMSEGDIPPALNQRIWARVECWLRDAEERVRRFLSLNTLLLDRLVAVLEKEEQIDGCLLVQMINETGLNTTRETQ